MARSKQKQPKQVTAAEKQVGERIAAFRKLRGISQGALGEAIGVTFQQVQKYEKGMNRASAGRLQQIAGILGVALSSFFDDLAGEDGPVSSEIISVLKKPGAADLLRAYASIRSPDRGDACCKWRASSLITGSARCSQPEPAKADGKRRLR